MCEFFDDNFSTDPPLILREITVNGRDIELIPMQRAGAIRTRWRVALYRGKANQIPMIPN